uniref:Uncharacterized protein n=1 Tax=viral metagenome TaxID=1070528 RepID=A0A6M3J544_9ZZZZ
MPDPWADYLKALNQCCNAVRLTAYHTRECAKHTERAATYALLTAYHVQEYTKRKGGDNERL